MSNDKLPEIIAGLKRLRSLCGHMATGCDEDASACDGAIRVLESITDMGIETLAEALNMLKCHKKRLENKPLTYEELYDLALERSDVWCEGAVMEHGLLDLGANYDETKIEPCVWLINVLDEPEPTARLLDIPTLLEDGYVFYRREPSEERV